MERCARTRKQTSTTYRNETWIVGQCPFGYTLRLLGQRWRPVILWKLRDGAAHFAQLARAIPLVTEKMLAQELKVLERDGLVRRRPDADRPGRIAYERTELGLSLDPILQQMFAWGERHGDQGDDLPRL